MIEYKVIRVLEKENLENLINDFSKENYILHSIVPVVIPGDHLHYEHVSFVVTLEKEVNSEVSIKCKYSGCNNDARMFDGIRVLYCEQHKLVSKEPILKCIHRAYRDGTCPEAAEPFSNYCKRHSTRGSRSSPIGN